MTPLSQKLKEAGLQTKRPNAEREVQRIFALATKEELQQEYELIKEKKSPLSKVNRDRVIEKVEKVEEETI